MSEIKPQVYKDSRPAEYFQPFHDWIRTHRPGWAYELVRMVLTPLILIVYRCLPIAAENVPADGAFLLTPNHFSNLDHFIAAVYIRRKVQFMAKSQLYGRPFLDTIFRVGGVFPVRRGHHDEEAFKTAYAVLARGSCVGMYAEGGRSRTGKLGEPKAGVGRLALESGVPVVPVAIHGSAGIRRWRKFRFPKVTVQYGEPISFGRVENPTYEQQMAVSQQIFDRIRDMYVALEERGRRSVIRSLRDGVAKRSDAKRLAHGRQPGGYS
jgi:1-acyl-sn-glycerol-3-phosphate acyltransferase